MRRIELTTLIRASRETCFDLACDLDLHARSQARHQERAVGGRTSGLIGPGEEVTWEARHFGLPLRHASRITAYERPSYFRDTMIAGYFKSFDHDHYFEGSGDGTVMRDVLVFESPFGPLGRLVDRLVLERYLERLLAERNAAIRREAEQRTGGRAG